MANTGRQLEGELAFAADIMSSTGPLPAGYSDAIVPLYTKGEFELAGGNEQIWSSRGRKFEPSPNLANWQVKAKRFCDIAFSTAAIIGFSPLLAIVSVAIVLESRGSVFFLQEREGKNGKPFTAIKFRSMRVTMLM